MDKKKKGIGEKLGMATLSYVCIYIITVVFSIVRKSMRTANSKEIGFGELLQMVLVPALFFAAGYVVTKVKEWDKLRVRLVLLVALVVQAAFWGLWFLSLDASVMLNLPVTQGSYALDHWLRTVNIVQGYEYKYLKETDMYKYAVLPGLYCLTGVWYGFCFWWGNYTCVEKRGQAKKSR